MEDLKKSLKKEAGSNSSIFDSLYRECGFESVRSMCDFTAPKFGEIWVMQTNHVSVSRIFCSSRKENLSGRDMLFITMCGLKNEHQWEFTGKLI